MATLVSTGQITIVDTNDARPITAYLTANGGTQQVFSKDESSVAFVPDWFAGTGLQIDAKVFVGTASGSQDITGQLTNRKFTLTLGGVAVTNATTDTSFVNSSNVAITNPFTVNHDALGSYIRVKGNLKDTVATDTVFFEGDYTDPGTGLVSHVIAQITLGCVKTGTNAVYVTIRGNNILQQSNTSTKAVIAMSADLVRSSGVDTTGLTYKWYEGGGTTQITTSVASYASKYGLKTVASGNPVPAVSDLGVGVPVAGTGNAFNTLVLSENAVTDVGIYRVDITDSDGKVYSAYFTVYDVCDPYEVRLISSSGDKLQNGVGTTTVTPLVYNGAQKVSDLTGWTFVWSFYDRNGKRAAFVDTAKISVTGGALVTANATGTSATFNYSGTSYAAVAGDIAKLVKPNGDAFFYEVASSTTNQITIRVPVTNTWLNFTDYPAPSAATDFVGGRLFICTTGGTRATAGATGIVVTGDEIDVKGNIVCEASRP